jgi:regulator of protease activity HflC (stomatin/prohibitin superfamily)
VKHTRSFSLVVVLLVSLLLTGCGVTRIEPGNVGIKVDLAGQNRTVDDVDIVSGWVTYNPFAVQIVQYPYITRRYEWHTDDQLRFNAQEGVGLGMDVALSIGVDPARAAELFVKYRRTLPEMIDNEIRDRVNGCMVDVAGRMRVDEIVGSGRTRLREESLVCIRERMNAEGFVVNDFQFTNDFLLPDLIRERINAQIEAQQAAIAAQNTVAQREAEARQRIAQATGEAEARRLQSQAEAAAIEIQGAALRANPEILQLQFIEAWDGVMPTTLISGGDANGFGGVLLNMGR